MSGCRTAWCAGRAACAQPLLETLVLQKKSLITGESRTVIWSTSISCGHEISFPLHSLFSVFVFFPTLNLLCLIKELFFSHFSNFVSAIIFIPQHCIIWKCRCQHCFLNQIPFMFMGINNYSILSVLHFLISRFQFAVTFTWHFCFLICPHKNCRAISWGWEELRSPPIRPRVIKMIKWARLMELLAVV